MTITIQKASLWKRVSAWIFDMILTITIAVGAAFVTSAAVNYDSYNDKMSAKYAEYEERYGIEVGITEEEYDALSPEMKDLYEEANEAFRNDSEVRELQARLFSLSLFILSMGALIGYFIWYFIIPLLFGNGQTLGKKCFSLAVMRTNSVKITSPILFVRSMLGMCAIETMVPILLFMMLMFGVLGSIALILIGLIGILQLVVMIMSSTNSTIHDLLSDTVVVDMSTQKIFESNDALIAHKEMLAAMEAAQANGEEYTPIDLFGGASYRANEETNVSTNEEKNQDSASENWEK